MKKFGFYKNLNKAINVHSQEQHAYNSKEANNSKIYAYKLILNQHEALLKKINSNKKEGL